MQKPVLYASTPRRERIGEPRTFREMITDSTTRFGERPAITVKVGSEFRRTTYRELGQRIDELAAGMVRLGLRHGDKVALVAENNVDWVASWLAVASVGGVSVPIYPELGAHEINSIIKASDSRFALVGVAAADKLETRPVEHAIVIPRPDCSIDDLAVTQRLGAKAIRLADVVANLAEDDRRRAASMEVRPGDLAALIYTSGTMGDPKGVMLSHRNLTSNALSVLDRVDVGTSDRLLHVLPLHHAFPFTAGLLAPLMAGVNIILENDLRRVRDRMGETHPTVFFGVPALYSQLHRTIVSRLAAENRLAAFRKGEEISRQVKEKTGINVGRLIFRELHAKLGGSIRFFAAGGAALPSDLARKYFLLGIPVIQGYGLSEASPVTAAQFYSPRRFLTTNYYEKLAGTVGPPMPGLEIAAIDVPDKNIHVALHGEGELMVRGPNVMQGYYKNENSTREIMIDDWLRTGDIGRLDRDGNVFITGRAKSVIVLDSGEKVYPDELEERFEVGGVVGEVCVIGRRSSRLLGDRKVQVCAVIYPDPSALQIKANEEGERVTPENVRKWVSAEVERAQNGTATFKRIQDVILTDVPLPKTDLRKVKRGQVKEHYSFDLEKLLTST